MKSQILAQILYKQNRRLDLSVKFWGFFWILLWNTKTNDSEEGIWNGTW